MNKRMKRISYSIALILIVTIVLFNIDKASAANMVLNGTFVSDILSWTAGGTGANTTATWQTPGQANGGFIRLRHNNNTKTTGSPYVEQSFNVSSLPVANATLTFYYRKAWANDTDSRKTPLIQTATVTIYKPDGSTLDTISYTGGDPVGNAGTSAWTQVTRTISKANFTATGNYKIRLSASLQGDSGTTAAGTWTDVHFDEVSFDVPIDTANPTTTWNAPSNLGGATYYASKTAPITLKANGTDDTGISNIKFYYGSGTLIGTSSTVDAGGSATNGTWSYNWNTSSTPALTQGTYTVYAQATDLAGKTSSNTVNQTIIYDTTAPTANISSPNASSKVRGTINITGTATDNLSFKNYKVEYSPTTTNTWQTLLDSTTPVSAGGTLHVWNTTTVADGTYDLKLTVYDNAGNTASTSQINGITVDNQAPVVAWNSPNTSPYYTDVATLTLKADGTENDGIVNMKFFNAPSTQIGITDTVPDTGTNKNGTYSTTWSPSEGSYTVYAQALDGAGNTGDSPNQTIVIDRTNPTASISSPTNNAVISGTYNITGTANDNYLNNYIVERSPTGANTWTQIGSNGVTNVNNGTLVAWDTTGLPNGSKYDLRVRVYDRVGHLTTSTLVTNITVGIPDAVAPAATWNSPNGNPTPYYTNSIALALQASGTDNIGVSSMNFYYLPDGNGGETPIGVDNTVDSGSATSGSWSYIWNMPPEGSHTVYARSIDGGNNPSANTALQTIIVDRTNPNVSVSDPASSTAVKGNYTISGTASDLNIDYYKLEYKLSGGGSWTQIGTSTTGVNSGSLMNWNTTALNGDYDLRLTAYDKAGNSSTVTVSNVIVDNTKPNAVSTLSSQQVNSTKIKLTWDKVNDNAGGVGVASYKIYRGPGNSGNTPTLVTTVTSDGSTQYNYTVTGLTPNTFYDFKVQAIDAAGNEQDSGNIVRTETTMPSDITPPANINNLAATTQAHDTIRLTWSGVSDNGNGMAYYEVYRVGNGTKLTTINSSGSSYSYNVTGLTPNTSYTFYVRAYDLDGNYSTSNNAPATTYPPPDAVPPGSVQNLRADVLSTKRIDLSWSKATDNVGVDHYNIYVGGDLIGTKVDGGGTTFTYSLGNLTANTTYTYVVKAVDAAGNMDGGVSVTATTNAATGSTDVTAPSSVSNFVGTPISNTSVLLTWNGNNSADGVYEYVIKISGDIVPLRKIRNNGDSAFSITVTDLSPNTPYNFEIVAIDTEGNQSNISTCNVTTKETDTVQPSQPSILDPILATENSLTINWSTSTDNVGVDHYNIYRSIDGSNYDTVGTASVTSFVSEGLRGNTLYYYKVSAVDAAGNESYLSLPKTGITSLDTSAPKILRVDPENNDVNIGYQVNIKVSFDDGLNVATVTSANVYLKTGATDVPVTVTYDSLNNLITLNPNTDLSQNTKYTVYVDGLDAFDGTAIKNSSGLSLAQSYSWSFTTGVNPFTAPHGYYTNDTSKCRLCHTLHNGKEAGLMKESTQTGMCFTCHDGTASQYNIASIFEADSGNITAHPVKNTNLVPGGLIKCSDCHNPHGVLKAGGGYYPRLLKGVTSDISTQGPNFCLRCHGSTQRTFDGSGLYYVNTFGDHSNPDAKHFDMTEPDLQPTSGSLVTCVMCHDKHASPNNRLIRESMGTEDTLCLKCHNKASNSTSESRNINDEFARAGSRHNIFDSDQTDGSRVECRSCHGPHSVDKVSHSASSSSTGSDISNPDNTWQSFVKTGSGVRFQVGRLSQFCITCHDGSAPVRQMIYNGVNNTIQIPYTILFPNNPIVGFTTNDTGWNKSGFINSRHYSSGVLECDSCHEQHGSSYQRLEKRPGSDKRTASTGMCLSCHNSGKPNGAPDIDTDLSRTGGSSSVHPVKNQTESHVDTEDYGSNTLTRHVECVDCHNPHEADNTTAAAPNVSGPLKGVSGYSVSSSRTALTSNGGSMIGRAQYQYQICYKCHSSYAKNRGTRDVAAEFAPNNKTFHPIEADSPNTKGFWQPGYSATTRLVCSDCHGSSFSATTKGPHGSDNSSILKAKYDANTGEGGPDTDLCFNCHKYSEYAGGTTDSNQTGFWDGGKNLHKRHVEKISFKCQLCHARVLHGNNLNRRLIVTTSDTAYKGSINKIQTYTDPGTGNYSLSNCVPSDSSTCYKHF